MKMTQKIHRFMWRAHFAGRMMEITRCGFREGMRRSDDALTINPLALSEHPRDVADARMWIYQCG